MSTDAIITPLHLDISKVITLPILMIKRCKNAIGEVKKMESVTKNFQ